MAGVLFSVCFSIQYVNMFKVSAYAVNTDVYATCSVFFCFFFVFFFGNCH